MKLLLCVRSLNDIQIALDQMNAQPEQDKVLPYLYFTRILPHEVDIIETGVGIFQTTYKVTKTLQRQRYHLALKVTLGNAYKDTHVVGTVLNILNEKPGDYGTLEAEEWKDVYDLELLHREDPPQVRGGFVNLTNAYMNVFAPFKKVVGISVNHFADKSLYPIRLEKYKADCETTDGLGFSYLCLYERQTYYHLCVIERNLATGAEDHTKATEVLNLTLVELIKKL